MQRYFDFFLLDKQCVCNNKSCLFSFTSRLQVRTLGLDNGEACLKAVESGLLECLGMFNTGLIILLADGIRRGEVGLGDLLVGPAQSLYALAVELFEANVGYLVVEVVLVAGEEFGQVGVKGGLLLVKSLVVSSDVDEKVGTRLLAGFHFW